ncbi:hemin-degrading factor [Taibaiella soli]|uniref:Hemin-degrading factor n=1 Tax=Taibaiella soli TaxID=1649169 RepID=A0A2W2B1Q8_9BACT|nr:ChuX/HutX family heme-like substrate-binding protein [Taibaiella soli]PZF73948.1 hemin-degrading factor [Taibaiella soli]
MENAILELKQQYEKAKAENPRLRIRDIAQIMHQSEAALVAMRTGDGVVRLEGDFKELLKEVHTLGVVMALTRNNNAVHERKGVYNNVSFEGPMGIVLDPDIDLRLFMMHWQFAFSVKEGDRTSLQFFDKSGEAVHKIYLTEESNVGAYEALVAKYTAQEQTPIISTVAYPAVEAELPDSEIDVAAFQEGWKNLKDTHEFFGLTRQFKLSRTQSLRLAPEGFVKEVSVDTTRKILEAASVTQVPIMVFVGSRGCIQIHTGTVTKLLATGPWFNVLDPEFSMHLREEAIVSSYIVKKPSTDGIVTALEIFCKDGQMIAQFFGKRKPGKPELEEWRAIVKDVTGF